MEIEAQRDHGDVKDEQTKVEDEKAAANGVQAGESIGDLIEVSNLSLKAIERRQTLVEDIGDTTSCHLPFRQLLHDEVYLN